MMYKKWISEILSRKKDITNEVRVDFDAFKDRFLNGTEVQYVKVITLLFADKSLGIKQDRVTGELFYNGE